MNSEPQPEWSDMQWMNQARALLGADAPTRDLDKAVHCDYRKAYKTWHKREHKREARRESISRIVLWSQTLHVSMNRESRPPKGGARAS